VSGNTVPATEKGEKRARSTDEIKEEIENSERKLKKLRTELSKHDVTRLERGYTSECARTARISLFKRWVGGCLRAMVREDSVPFRNLRKTIRDSHEERRHYDYMDAARPGILDDERLPAVVLDRVRERGVQYLHDVQGYVQLDEDDGGKQCRYEVTLYSNDTGRRVMITNYRHNATMIRLPTNDKECGSDATVFLVRALVHVCKIHPGWIATQLSAIGTHATKPESRVRLMLDPYGESEVPQEKSTDALEITVTNVVPETKTLDLLKEVVARTKALEVRFDALASFLEKTPQSTTKPPPTPASTCD